jgi:transposase-like protein
MIRLFTIFCKLNFIIPSAKQLFLSAMEDYSIEKIPFLELSCSNCGAKHPTWAYHDSYERCLISYQNKSIIIDTIDITRIICSSCNGTHAILPEVIIPFRSYSLLFVLAALKEHFTSSITVAALCDKYQISASTLYEWKHLFDTHKKLWLGVLEDIYQKAQDFLSSILNTNTSDRLKAFFSNNKISFLQGRTITARLDSG